jgi:hypothetical protein
MHYGGLTKVDELWKRLTAVLNAEELADVLPLVSQNILALPVGICAVIGCSLLSHYLRSNRTRGAHKNEFTRRREDDPRMGGQWQRTPR